MFEVFGEQGGGQMNTAAISLHELFMSYRRAGFSEDQAFELTIITLKSAYLGGAQ